MKKVSYMFSAIALLLAGYFIACNKDINALNPIVNNVNNPIGLIQSVLPSPDALIRIEGVEHFDSDNNGVSIRGTFPNEDKFIDAGTMSVSGLSLKKDAINRSNMDLDIEQAKALLGSDLKVDFDATVEGFKDFNANIYLPKKLSVTSNLDGSDYFDKNQNLDLRWTTDSRNQKIFIIICAAGSPCISKEVADNGEYTIDKSTFKDFEKGARVWVEVIRGNMQNFLIENKNYYIVAGNRSSMTSRLIK